MSALDQAEGDLHAERGRECELQARAQDYRAEGQRQVREGDPQDKHHSKCMLLVSVHKTITRSGVVGSNKFSFTGMLAAGTYELTVTPAGGPSQTVTFKVTG